MEDKIKTREEIRQIAEDLRRNAKRIVTTNGAFDILHVGHVRSLYAARQYGDCLIVGLNSDSSVRGYKGPNRPINNQADRADFLSALECVDYVVIFDEPDPRELLRVIKPHYHVKSKSGFKGIEREVIESNGGQIVLLEDLPGYSTTNLLNRLLQGEG